MIRLLIAYCILFSFSSLLAQENPVDLNYEKALEMAFTNDPGLEAADNSIIVERQKIHFAKSFYKPRLSSYGNLSRTSLENAIEIANPITNVPMVIDISPENRYRFGFVLSQEIYTFGRRPALTELAQRNVTLKKIEKKQYMYQVFQNTTIAFSNLILARDLLEISKQNINRAKSKLAIVNARIEEGLAGKYDQIKAELLLARYENDKIIAVSRFEQTKTVLAELVNWSNPYFFFPAGDLTVISPQIPEMENININDRPDLSRLGEFINIQSEQTKINKSEFFPKLMGLASYDWANGYQPDLDKLDGFWTVGLSFEWLFYDGGARKSKLAQARYGTRVAENYRDDLKSIASSQIKKAFIAFESIQSSMIIAKRSLELADEGLKIAEARYNEGLLPISDMIDLEIDKSTAEAALQNIRFEMILKMLDLKASTGYYPELSNYVN